MNNRVSKKNLKVRNRKNKGSNYSYLQSRSRRIRIRRMKGGTSESGSISDAVRSVSDGGDINTLINSNHLPIIPLSDSGVSPLPAGINTRDDALFGGGGKVQKKRIPKKKYRSVRHRTTKRKIRFSKNRKNRSRSRSRNNKKIKGGSGPPFFLPDDITNFKDSIVGNLSGAVNGYKGVETPYQITHTYPYQQSPYEETYNSSSISDANANYNKADNYVVSKY